MSNTFDTINIHTLLRKLIQTNIPGKIIKFIVNYIKGRKAYITYRNHTSINLKLTFPKVASPKVTFPKVAFPKVAFPKVAFLKVAFPKVAFPKVAFPKVAFLKVAFPKVAFPKVAFSKVASSHPRYLTFTRQIYHHTEHRFRSWPTQLTSPYYLHTQARVHKVDPVDYTSNLNTKNKQHCTTHGNEPKGYGSSLRPKYHIQHTHSDHISTRTQSSTNNKSTHRNRMGKTEGDTHGYMQGSHETGSGVYLFHMIAFSILD